MSFSIVSVLLTVDMGRLSLHLEKQRVTQAQRQTIVVLCTRTELKCVLFN